MGTFSCNANRRYGGKVCTTHYISLEQVKAIVLADIRRHAMLAAEDADAYADSLMGLPQAGQLSEQKAMKKELDAAQRRLSELATLVQRIYEDNVFGRLSNDLYQTLSAKYEAETKELVDKIYDGSVDKLFAALLGRKKLSAEQIQKLKQIVEDLE